MVCLMNGEAMMRMRFKDWRVSRKVRVLRSVRSAISVQEESRGVDWGKFGKVRDLQFW